VDYSDHIVKRLAPPPQDYVVFTYDVYQVGQTSGPYVKPPQHIISLREKRWKIAEARLSVQWTNWWPRPS
jgi:choline-sulfatase